MSEARFIASSGGRLRWPGGEARCALGRAGVLPALSKLEGDGASPLGSWPMRRLLWRPDRLGRPVTGLPAGELSPEAGWCDDPGDRLYNQPVRLPYPGRHEQLWRGDHLYDLLIVLGYNDDPVVAGRGSAIFLHVAHDDYAPTEGCVACSRADLLALLAEAREGDELGIVA